MTAFVKIGEFIVKNAETIAIATAAAVGGFIAGTNKDKIRGALSRGNKKATKETSRKKRVSKKAKRTNAKAASGNRKAQAKSASKKTATKNKPIGEKAAEVAS